MSYDEDKQLSPKVEAFLDEVRAVCRKHGLQISTSLYDGFQVWPLRKGEEELYGAGIEDMTDGDE